MTKVYEFRDATIEDLDLLIGWTAEPHVRAWWGDDEPFVAEEMTDPRVARWIVSFEGNPFAYMQDYAVHGWEDHYFAHLPKGSRGVDQFIGEADMMGKGHGTAFMRQHIEQLFSEGAPVVATDPDPKNTRAIAVYEKVGFRAYRPAMDTKWGRILPMRIDRP